MTDNYLLLLFIFVCNFAFVEWGYD